MNMSSKKLIGSYEVKLREKEDLLLVYDILMKCMCMSNRLISFQITVISINKIEISMYMKDF